MPICTCSDLVVQYYYMSSAFVSGCCSKYLKSVWYNTSIVPDCTLVHTARGPTPRNQPATPSVLYMIFSPVITDEVSNVAAPCAFNVVEGEDVDIGRLWDDSDLLGLAEVECFEEPARAGVDLGAFVEL
jgi:hypothetical protein